MKRFKQHLATKILCCVLVLSLGLQQSGFAKVTDLDDTAGWEDYALAIAAGGLSALTINPSWSSAQIFAYTYLIPKGADMLVEACGAEGTTKVVASAAVSAFVVGALDYSSSAQSAAREGGKAAASTVLSRIGDFCATVISKAVLVQALIDAAVAAAIAYIKEVLKDAFENKYIGEALGLLAGLLGGQIIKSILQRVLNVFGHYDPKRGPTAQAKQTRVYYYNDQGKLCSQVVSAQEAQTLLAQLEARYGKNGPVELKNGYNVFVIKGRQNRSPVVRFWNWLTGKGNAEQQQAQANGADQNNANAPKPSLWDRLRYGKDGQPQKVYGEYVFMSESEAMRYQWSEFWRGYLNVAMYSAVKVLLSMAGVDDEALVMLSAAAGSALRNGNLFEATITGLVSGAAEWFSTKTKSPMHGSVFALGVTGLVKGLFVDEQLVMERTEEPAPATTPERAGEYSVFMERGLERAQQTAPEYRTAYDNALLEEYSAWQAQDMQEKYQPKEKGLWLYLDVVEKSVTNANADFMSMGRATWQYSTAVDKHGYPMKQFDFLWQSGNDVFFLSRYGDYCRDVGEKGLGYAMMKQFINSYHAQAVSNIVDIAMGRVNNRTYVYDRSMYSRQMQTRQQIYEALERISAMKEEKQKVLDTINQQIQEIEDRQNGAAFKADDPTAKKYAELLSARDILEEEMDIAQQHESVLKSIGKQIIGQETLRGSLNLRAEEKKHAVMIFIQGVLATGAAVIPHEFGIIGAHLLAGTINPDEPVSRADARLEAMQEGLVQAAVGAGSGERRPPDAEAQADSAELLGAVMEARAKINDYIAARNDQETVKNVVEVSGDADLSAFGGKEAFAEKYRGLVTVRDTVSDEAVAGFNKQETDRLLPVYRALARAEAENQRVAIEAQVRGEREAIAERLRASQKDAALPSEEQLKSQGLSEALQKPKNERSDHEQKVVSDYLAVRSFNEAVDKEVNRRVQEKMNEVIEQRARQRAQEYVAAKGSLRSLSVLKDGAGNAQYRGMQQKAPQDAAAGGAPAAGKAAALPQLRDTSGKLVSPDAVEELFDKGEMVRDEIRRRGTQAPQAVPKGQQKITTGQITDASDNDAKADKPKVNVPVPQMDRLKDSGLMMPNAPLAPQSAPPRTSLSGEREPLYLSKEAAGESSAAPQAALDAEFNRNDYVKQQAGAQQGQAPAQPQGTQKIASGQVADSQVSSAADTKPKINVAVPQMDRLKDSGLMMPNAPLAPQSAPPRTSLPGEREPLPVARSAESSPVPPTAPEAEFNKNEYVRQQPVAVTSSAPQGSQKLQKEAISEPQSSSPAPSVAVTTPPGSSGQTPAAVPVRASDIQIADPRQRSMTEGLPLPDLNPQGPVLTIEGLTAALPAPAGPVAGRPVQAAAERETTANGDNVETNDYVSVGSDGQLQVRSPELERMKQAEANLFGRPLTPQPSGPAVLTLPAEFWPAQGNNQETGGAPAQSPATSSPTVKDSEAVQVTRDVYDRGESQSYDLTPAGAPRGNIDPIVVPRFDNPKLDMPPALEIPQTNAVPRLFDTNGKPIPTEALESLKEQSQAMRSSIGAPTNTVSAPTNTPSVGTTGTSLPTATTNMPVAPASTQSPAAASTNVPALPPMAVPAVTNAAPVAVPPLSAATNSAPSTPQAPAAQQRSVAVEPASDAQFAHHTRTADGLLDYSKLNNTELRNLNQAINTLISSDPNALSQEERESVAGIIEYSGLDRVPEAKFKNYALGVIGEMGKRNVVPLGAESSAHSSASIEPLPGKSEEPSAVSHVLSDLAAKQRQVEGLMSEIRQLQASGASRAQLQTKMKELDQAYSRLESVETQARKVYAEMDGKVNSMNAKIQPGNTNLVSPRP